MAIVLALPCSEVSAIDLAKPFTKATDWVAKQSGVKPTMDNVNNAAKSAQDVAKEAQKAETEVAPKLNDMLDSLKNTSDNASINMTLLRWPLFVSSVFLCLWLFGRAIDSWRVALSRPPKTA